MKIAVDDQELFRLNATQKKVIMNDIDEDVFGEDMKRRLQWVLMHKYERCFDRLKKEWEPRLIASGVSMIPVDKDAFAELVFNHPQYKSRKQRKDS